MPNKPARPKEDAFNYRLADLLADCDLDAKPEFPVGGRRYIDVLVEVGGRKVAVECKKGILPAIREEALAAAAGRVGAGLATSAVAVCYPEGLNLDRFGEDTKLFVAPLSGAAAAWREMTVESLAAVIRRVSDNLQTIDAAAAVFKDDLKGATVHLSDRQLDDIVQGVDIPLGSEQPALRAALLVASACLFHARLDGAQIRKPRTDARTGKPYDGEGWPPKALRDCLAEADLIRELEKSWNTILAVDYKPVFETALAAIGSPRVYDTGLSNFVRGCAYAALAATGALTSGQTDLLGRVFHFILDEKKNTGAFYTSTAAGAILAGLAIRDEDVTGDLDYSVVDPACGTGTLLAASAARIQDITGQHGRLVGKELIEEVLHGYDIDITATHMAAVTLGLMAPDVAFRKMNIRRFPLGYVPDEVSGGRVAVCGSLELMGDDGLAKDAGWPRGRTSRQVDSLKAEVIEAERRDLVIMNPPYTGQQTRHDHLPEEEKKAVKKREGEIIWGTAAPKSGSSGMFLYLADRLCKKEGGTVASVIPTSWFGGTDSRQAVWRDLLKRFHLEIVITSHDRGRSNFSENTFSNESLVILRRKGGEGENLPTRFVNLTANPKKADDAIGLTEGIRSEKIKGVLWPAENVEAGDWTPVKFYSPALLDAASRWFGDGELGLEKTLGEVADTGPGYVAVSAPWGAYHREKTPDAGGRRGLWFNNQNNPRNAPPKTTLRLSPDCYLHPKEGAQREADRLWAKRGRLFMPDRFRTNVFRTIAAVTDEPMLGAMWMPLRPKEAMAGWEEATAVYLNSTVGIFAVLYRVKPDVLSYPKLKVENLRRIPVPDLTEEQAAALSAVYGEVKDEPLRRFCDQADDPVRRRLDAAVCEAMGWDLEEVAGVRAALAAEPSVAGRRGEIR